MGSKLNPGIFDCFDAALPDEDRFVLLARDPRAPELIEQWAALRQLDITQGKRPAEDVSMVEEAFQCAARMRAWRTANMGAWRVSGTVEFIYKFGKLPPGTLYDGGAVLCFEKDRVRAIFCRIKADEPWPPNVTYDGQTFRRFGDQHNPTKYSTYRGDSTDTGPLRG